MNNLRSQFPILNTQLNRHDLIYLDSAATSQKPKEVIDAMTDFYANHNASSHSVHSLGGKVTEMVEETRQVVADLVGSSVDEIVFTSGATEGINLIANGFLEVSLRSRNNVAATSATPLLVVENAPSNFTPHVTPDGLSRQPLRTKRRKETLLYHELSKGQFPPNLSQAHQTGSFAPLKMTNLLVEKFKLDKNSEILICVDQHHSNILPWQRLAELVGCKIVFFGVLATGLWDMIDFQSKLNSNTKVIAVSNVSNVLGVVQDIGAMNEVLKLKFQTKITPVSLETASPLARGNLDLTQSHSGTGSFAPLKMTQRLKKPIVVLDATQAVSHFDVDVKDMDVDFLVFSGHKIYGPTGVGVLYGKRKLLEVLPSYKVGGDMVESVSLDKNVYKDSPFRFEAGTANFASIIGLKAALYWFIRSREEIFEVERKLFKYLVEKLEEIERLGILVEVEFQNQSNPSHFVPAPYQGATNPNLSQTHHKGSFAPLKMTKNSNVIPKIPLVSFNIEGINSLDLALILDQQGICVRSGQHCAGILHEYLGMDSSCRISLACFNTFEEIDCVIETIKDAVKILK
jgi:cysteine desulfurase / selenocysteine lyase